ncbi:hypothetical protein RQP46_010748 [Phenoliferia psychrophenolica]
MFLHATKIGCDVLSIFVQIFGALLSTSTSTSSQNLAMPILKIGYLIQVVSVALFLMLAVISEFFPGGCTTFIVPIDPTSTAQIRAKKSWILDERWTRCLTQLYVGGSIILFRCIYRFVGICITTTDSSGNTTYPLEEKESVAPATLCRATADSNLPL